MAGYDEICAPSTPTVLWAVFGGIILVWGALVFFLVRRRGRAVLSFAVVAVPLLAIAVVGQLREASRFIGASVAGDSVTLRYPWPRGDVAIPAAGVRAVTVEREQHVVHGKSGSGVEERGWMVVDGEGGERRSCRTHGFDRLVAGGKAIGGAAQKAPAWNVRCADGREVATTAEVLGAASAADFQGLCGGAKSPSDVR